MNSKKPGNDKHKSGGHAEPKPECHDDSQLSTERNRYFTGKYMTARDFCAEQQYFLSHHRWHQWTLHGWGIVWGLQVKLEGECLRIEPGMAIDCHGRELILSHAVQFPVGDVLENSGPESTHAAQKQPDYPAPKQPDNDGFLIGLRFNTIERDPVPVLLDDECRSGKNSHNRIQELAEICWQKYSNPTNSDKCWDYPRSHLPAQLPEPIPPSQQVPPKVYSGDWRTLQEHNHPDDCGCSHPPVALKPPCECGDCGFVPLARLRQVDKQWQADDLGCRYVQSPFYGEALTHIVGINWTHGGETCFQDIRKDYPAPHDPAATPPYAAKMHSQCNGSLARIIITFDRPLALPGGCTPDKVQEISTYLAQLIRLDYVVLEGDDDHDLDGDDSPTTLAPKVVQLSPFRYQLYCDFQSNRVQRDLNVRMRFALNCDLLLDERGRAVDGDHLGGFVPNMKDETDNKYGKLGRSGNRIEGGVFYSWTKLKP